MSLDVICLKVDGQGYNCFTAVFNFNLFYKRINCQTSVSVFFPSETSHSTAPRDQISRHERNKKFKLNSITI